MSRPQHLWIGVAVFALSTITSLGLGRLLIAADSTAPQTALTAAETLSFSPPTPAPTIDEPVIAVVESTSDVTTDATTDVTTNATMDDAGTTDLEFESSFGAEPHPLSVGDWDLAFADEFEGALLDADAWSTCHWWNDDGCTIASNHELEWYQPDNVAILNGALRLTAKDEASVSPAGDTFAYTSGMVSSGRDHQLRSDEPRFAFTHGYAEMRARFPSGAGLWPSFWLLPEDHRSKPQIDIMAAVGDSPSVLRIHTNYITKDSTERSDGIHHHGPDLSEDWHVFGLLWEESRLVWYLDGEKIWTTTDPREIPDEPMYLLASLAVGGDYPGVPTTATRFPATFHIDYIRVWQPTP
jgi:beta-glucanase (GH16 family)